MGKYDRQLVICKQERTACFAYLSGKCKVLEDTEFGKKACPFYKTPAMVNLQLKEIKQWKKRNVV